MSGPPFDLVAIGELCPDMILSGIAAAGPALGTEQEMGAYKLVLGSATAIATVLATRLGLSTALVSRVGRDDYGRFCLDALETDGVDASGVILDETTPTGLTVSLTYPSDRLLVTYPGTMRTLTAADFPEDLLRRGRHLHSSSFFLQPALQAGLPELFAAARAHGLTTSLDTGYDPGGTWLSDSLRRLLPHVDVFLPNEVELRHIGGSDHPDEAAAAILALGARQVAAKLGAAGSALYEADGKTSCPGFTVDPIDTTGAGDAFNCGYLYGLLTGEPPQARLRLGNACGALTATAIGGTGGIHSLDQVRRFMDAARDVRRST